LRLEVRERKRGEVDLPLLFAAVLLLGGAVAAGWLLLGLPVPPCTLKTLTGMPCPTCGMTRMADAAVHGRPLEAFLWNPLVALGALGVLGAGAVSGVRRILGRPRLRLVLDRLWERNLARLAALLALLGGWIYLVLSGV
jgi:hypothetical protein